MASTPRTQPRFEQDLREQPSHVRSSVRSKKPGRSKSTARFLSKNPVEGWALRSFPQLLTESSVRFGASAPLHGLTLPLRWRNLLSLSKEDQFVAR
jgi:hypothetical protein